MKDHGLKIIAAGLLLTLVVLPGHGQQKTAAPKARAGNQKVLPEIVRQEDCDCMPVDLADVDQQVSRAMEEASIAMDDAKLDAVLAELDQERVSPAPEAEQEPGESGNVFVFTDDEGHGWLGVNIAEVTAEKVKELKLPAERGVLITGVETDSPAAKAGLKSGDVITELNGLRLEGTAQFQRLVRETPAGRTMALTVWRDGRAQTISAALAAGRVSRHRHESYSWPGGDFNMRIPAMPAMPAMPRMGEFFAPRTPRLGVDVEDLSGDLGKYFGAPDGEGVLIRDISSGSPAEKAGMKAGDVIIKVAGERVKTSSDLRAGLREKRESKKVDVVVIRKGTEMTLPVEIEPVAPPEGRRVARRVAA